MRISHDIDVPYGGVLYRGSSAAAKIVRGCTVYLVMGTHAGVEERVIGGGVGGRFALSDGLGMERSGAGEKYR